MNEGEDKCRESWQIFFFFELADVNKNLVR